MLPKFNSPEDSHEHSLDLLNMLYQFDEFMSSVNTVVDMGCSTGLDLAWWATRYDDNIPRNYNCIGIEKHETTVNLAKNKTAKYKNVTIRNDNFERVMLDTNSADLIWCHDSFQYARNPMQTLKHWNSILAPGGMIYLCLPYTVNRMYNKLGARIQSNCFYSHMPANILLMLAVTGYDCSDARIYKKPGDLFYQITAYKDVEKDITTDSNIYEIAESGRLPESAVKCINKFGYLDDNTLTGVWFNGSVCSFEDQ